MNSERLQPPSVPPGLVVRSATQADNQALIDLELESALQMGEDEQFFDRSPDAFACCAPHPGCRLVVGEIDGRIVGMMAGLVHSPVLQGRARTLVYIHRGRVHPDFHHHGVAWALSNDLFRWSAQFGATGPYYAISPFNERSVAFGGRAGGRWPPGLVLAEFAVESAAEASALPLPDGALKDAVGLINRAHSSEDFFEPLTDDRLRRRRQAYGAGNLLGAWENGSLVAAAALWDKGATTERIDAERLSGVTSRSRTAVVVDWGCESGHEDALGGLLRALAARSRALGRSTLTICDPRPGRVPDIGLARHDGVVDLYTPALATPPQKTTGGLYVDLLYL